MTWRGNGDLATLRGQSLRMRFFLRRARLHALQFV